LFIGLTFHGHGMSSKNDTGSDRLSINVAAGLRPKSFWLNDRSRLLKDGSSIGYFIDYTPPEIGAGCYINTVIGPTFSKTTNHGQIKNKKLLTAAKQQAANS
jgi:hypothetical protein